MLESSAQPNIVADYYLALLSAKYKWAFDLALLFHNHKFKIKVGLGNLTLPRWATGLEEVGI
jgi:hypothetical protein